MNLLMEIERDCLCFKSVLPGLMNFEHSYYMHVFGMHIIRSFHGHIIHIYPTTLILVYPSRSICTPKSIFAYQYHEFWFLFGILFIRTFMRSGWTMTPLSHCKSSTFKTPHSWQIQCKCLDYRIFSFWYSPFFYFHGHNGSSLCDFPCSDSSYWSGFRESQVLVYNMNENTNRPACSPSSVVLLRRTTLSDFVFLCLRLLTHIWSVLFPIISWLVFVCILIMSQVFPVMSPYI